MRVTLEIAVTTPDEAVAAERAGADRLELCAALEVGGVTPSMGVFERVRDLVEVPVWVLLRPRPGGFLYTTEEYEATLRDTEAFVTAGADGIVIGALDGAGNVALEECRRLSRLARGRIVFHRAFDFAVDPRAALERLVELGFARVLTSGGRRTALEGSAAIRELLGQAAGRIPVMPGGGVRPDNVAELVRATGCREVHSSARLGVRHPGLERNPGLARAMGAEDAVRTFSTDAALVAGLRTALDHLGQM